MVGTECDKLAQIDIESYLNLLFAANVIPLTLYFIPHYKSSQNIILNVYDHRSYTMCVMAGTLPDNDLL